MYREKNYLPKGSVRSLPKGKLQDIRCMFDQPHEGLSPSSTNVHKTGAKLETITDTEHMANDSTPPPKWRQHITEPKHREGSPSPVRTRTPTPPKYGHYPTPTPRKPPINPDRKNSAPSVTESGISKLPLAMFGQIASGVAMSDSSSSQVNKVIGRFESNGNQPESNTAKLHPDTSAKLHPDTSAKIPLKPRPISPRRKSPSPARHQSSSSPKKSPLLVRRPQHEPQKRDENHYSCIWKEESPGKNTSDDKSRAVSVFERSKLFENISGSPNSESSTPTKPAKPPPPMRQRSLNDEQSGGGKLNSAGKNPPPRPPFRQRSVTEKSNKSDSNQNESTDNSVAKKNPPPPPSKPKRTGAHDDYMKVKLEHEAAANKVKLESEEMDNFEQIQSKDMKNDSEFENNSGAAQKLRPRRPPPPRKKARPFSIATGSINDFRSSEDSDFEDCSQFRSNSIDDNPFYEMVSIDAPPPKGGNDPIKHWDLPRMSHPEPSTIRRSHSAECLQKAVDNDGNVLYMDPMILSLDDKSRPGYDIYEDTEGYAVPNRLVKRPGDQNESSRPMAHRLKSKMKRFKNLFTEPDNKSSASDKQAALDSRNSQKRKLDVIRQKVNQAFEVLQGSFKHKAEAEDDTQAERLSNDSDSRVDEGEIKKRVEYSRSVRIKTQKSIRQTSREQKKIYPQLFEHAMIVGLQQNADTGIYEPYVIYKFPEIRNYKLTMEGKLFPCSESKDSNVSVPLFCFPDAANFKPSSSSSKSQSYNFVLTNFDGGRVYGYCRRLVPRKLPMKVPEVICIISPVDANSMYNELLLNIERKRQESLDAAQELIAAAFGRPLPSPGQSELVRTLDEDGEMETVSVSREADNRIDNANVECLLTHLGSDKLLKVFATVLLERSVLFCAKQLSTLSSTIHAIISLLYPFSWQHTFIPVLPSDMIDVVCSPVPYIIGITASLLPKALDTPLEENVLIIDIDKRSFIRCQGDESTLLPKKIEKALKTSLNMCRIDSDAKSFPNVMISEAFLKFFVEAIGHYAQYIDKQEDGRMTFEKEAFVKGVSSSTMQQLLEWLVETQMFEVFMTKQLEKDSQGCTIELFDSRIHEKFTPGKKFHRQLAKKLTQ